MPSAVADKPCPAVTKESLGAGDPSLPSDVVEEQTVGDVAVADLVKALVALQQRRKQLRWLAAAP